MSQGIAQMMMDDPKLMRPDAHSVGPPMGVSIGIASLVIIIFSSSIALACCYCRDKFWLPRRSSPQPDIEQPPQRPDAAAKVQLWPWKFPNNFVARVCVIFVRIVSNMIFFAVLILFRLR